MGNLLISAFRTFVFSKWILFYTMFEKMLLCRLVANPLWETNHADVVRKCKHMYFFEQLGLN